MAAQPAGEQWREQLKNEVYAAYRPLEEQILDHTTHLEQDVELVLERSFAVVAGHPEYENFFQLVHSALTLDSIPEPIQSTLRDTMVGVPYVESRIDPAAVSPDQAFGVMQLMPATWAEHAQPDDDPADILAQVRVAGALLEQAYRFLAQRHEAAFATIAEMLYGGDRERCDREFVTLLVMAAYFSGMGTVSRVLDQFTHDYVTLADQQRMEAAGITTDTYGPYSVLTEASQQHQYDPNFGPYGIEYVPKVLAARLVLQNSLPPNLAAELRIAVGPSVTERQVN